MYHVKKNANAQGVPTLVTKNLVGLAAGRMDVTNNDSLKGVVYKCLGH
jgi:hypothetical protein